MQPHSWLAAVAFAGFVFLPAGVLLFMTFAVWSDQKGIDLSERRRATFRLATFTSLSAALMFAATDMHYLLTPKAPSRFWTAWFWTAFALWLIGMVGAFFGKHKGRILLLFAQCATLLCAFFCTLAIFAY
jgi:hypothetical protein